MASFQIICSTRSLISKDFSYILDYAANTSFDGLDADVRHIDRFLAEAGNIKVLRVALKEKNAKIVSLSGSYDFLSAGEDAFAAGCRHLDLAAELRIPVLGFTCPGDGVSKLSEDERDMIIKRLVRFSRYACKKGVVLGCEVGTNTFFDQIQPSLYVMTRIRRLLNESEALFCAFFPDVWELYRYCKIDPALFFAMIRNMYQSVRFRSMDEQNLQNHITDSVFNYADLVRFFMNEGRDLFIAVSWDGEEPESALEEELICVRGLLESSEQDTIDNGQGTTG